jgi:hypothetical protein
MSPRRVTENKRLERNSKLKDSTEEITDTLNCCVVINGGRPSPL